MTKDNLEETMELREWIREQMPEKRWFAPSTRKDFEDAMNYGFALVCVVKGKVIASLQCLLENTDYCHDRYEDEKMWSRCADYSDTFVHPDYQGNGLQRLMEEKMEKLCREAGKTILLGTVDPENCYSRENFRKMGYKEVTELKKYGGLRRILMEKKLQ